MPRTTEGHRSRSHSDSCGSPLSSHVLRVETLLGIPRQLIAQDTCRHFIDRPTRQRAKLERAVRDADQPRYRKPEMRHHTAHLPVAPLAQADGQPCIVALARIEARI